jgi:hypothetical protein
MQLGRRGIDPTGTLLAASVAPADVPQQPFQGQKQCIFPIRTIGGHHICTNGSPLLPCFPRTLATLCPLAPFSGNMVWKELAACCAVQACLRVLAGLVRGWQACRAQREVRVQFWLGDALQLCQYDLEAASYSAVDTSNLADHVGLLNLLACVPWVLQQSPHARLGFG